MKEMQLGEVIGKFYRFERAAQEGHEDISRWHAPSECHDLFNRALDTDYDTMLDALEERGWTTDRIKKELRERGISYKWLYENGLSNLVY